MDKRQRLQKLIQIRDSYLALSQRQVMPKKERKRQLVTARNAADKLRRLLPELPQEHLYDWGDDGQEDYTLLDRMLDNLMALDHALERIELHGSGNLQGVPEDVLVRQLGALEPGGTCYWSEREDAWSGRMVVWFKDALYYMKRGLDPQSQDYMKMDLDPQSLAIRWHRLSNK